MTDDTSPLQAVLSVVDEMVDRIDKPFVLIALSSDDEVIFRSNIDPAGLRQIVTGLGEAAVKAEAAVEAAAGTGGSPLLN